MLPAISVSMGHLRRETYLISPSASSPASPSLPLTFSVNSSSPPLPSATTKAKLSSRLERWSPSEQVYPTSESMKSYFSSPAYCALFDKYQEILERDGGANEAGVGVIDIIHEGGERKAELVVDMEVCSCSSLSIQWREELT